MKKLILIICIILFYCSPASAFWPEWKAWDGDSWETVDSKRWDGDSWYTLPYEYYDFWVIAGQSNAQGNGDYTLSPTVADGVEILWNGTIIEEISDPIGYDSETPWSGSYPEEYDYGTWHEASTGSLGPSFAQKYYELTGRNVILLALGRGSTGQCEAGDNGWGWWTDSLWDLAEAEIDDALTELTTAEYPYKFKGLIWYQGENDSLLSVSAAAYTICAEDMIDTFYTHYSAYDVSFNMVQIGPTSCWGSVIYDAQTALASDRDDVWLITNVASMGCPHHTQAVYNTIGEKIATEITGR